VPWAAGLEWFAGFADRARLRPTSSALAVLQVPNLSVGSQTPKMNSSNTILTFLTADMAAAQPARTQLNAALTQMITALSTELLSSVGVGGGASRRFSELVKPATSWSAGC
jgi:hypothetical protein